LTDKNLERIRAANRARERKYGLVDKSPLIAELDGHIINLVENNFAYEKFSVEDKQQRMQGNLKGNKDALITCLSLL
jgi:hypothetical protein